MDGPDWADPNARAMAIYLDGVDDPDRAEDGTPLIDDDFLILVNSWWEPLGLVLPETRPGRSGMPRSTATTPLPPPEAVTRSAGDQVTVGPGPSPSCVLRHHDERSRCSLISGTLS